MLSKSDSARAIAQFNSCRGPNRRHPRQSGTGTSAKSPDRPGQWAPNAAEFVGRPLPVKGIGVMPAPRIRAIAPALSDFDSTIWSSRGAKVTAVTPGRADNRSARYTQYATRARYCRIANAAQLQPITVSTSTTAQCRSG